MGNERFLLLFTGLIACLRYSDGQCQMEGVDDWRLTVTDTIYDIDRGVVFNRTTTNIEEIVGGINTGEGVNAARYLTVNLQNSVFTITTTPDYALYEEYEVLDRTSFSVNFRCTGGVQDVLAFEIFVIDTNNNAPEFRPTAEYEFTITPPLPPGFQITGCGDDDNVVVRDIDLTTQAIVFEIEDNPYFELEYNGRSSTDQKEFLGLLRTKDLIRSLPGVVELTISATDVHLTPDPDLTTIAIIRIQPNDDFQFPDEPIFSQPFYLATYTETNQLVVQGTISLQQGFDDQVIFGLEGEDSESFSFTSDGNQVSISVVLPLSTEILRSGRLVLVVTAEREHTSGATAPVIVTLPEVPGLQFEQTHYEGRIVDNVLQPTQLTLQQGYESGFNVALFNEHASSFTTNVQGNVITLSMTPLESTVINENNFITLRVVASNDFSSTTAIVTLEIIKDDNVTPVFERAVYSGEYDQATGLSIERIVLAQGFDNSVTFSLDGEYATHFQINNDGPEVFVTSSGIPAALWAEQLILTVTASRSRSVPATAAISIRLPSARELAFESNTYRGTLQDDNLTLQSIVLTNGFAADVTFTISGDYANSFTFTNEQNQVTISLPAPLPDSVILENNFLTLTLSASGLHAIPTSAAVVLEIIKQDVTTPVFTENIYRATYEANAINVGDIRLVQGFDNTVTFRLDGEHSQYFGISNDGSTVNLELRAAIPEELIFREKVLLFSVVADKPLTVGANAAVSITFPQELTDATEMRFSQNTYVGSIMDNVLSLDNIVLELGFATGTNFTMTGDYASYFSIQNTGNVVTISIANIPNVMIEDNNFIVLELEASRERAVSTSASIVIKIVEPEIVPPVFSEAFYRGVYADNELQFNDVITLSQGYDQTVSFDLEGAYSIWFSISTNGNLVTLSRNSSIEIPEEVLENNNQILFTIVATKPETISARAAISIDLPKEIPEPVIMRFAQSSYVGSIDNGVLYAPAITLLGDRDPIQLNLTGDFASYFQVSHIGNDVQLQSINQIPEEEIADLAFIILDIQASYPEAINGYTTVVLEIIKPAQIVTPVFERAYYTGEYTAQGGLQFNQSIQLIQGFDESVLFTLTGDDAQWFELVSNEQNSLTLNVRDTGLGQIRDKSHLVFSVLANKAESVPGRAAVIINLADLTTTVPLRFSQNYYRGLIESDELKISNISLVEGYSSDMIVSFTGDHANYFQLTNQEGEFSLQLLELPSEVTDGNNVLVFTLEVQIGDTRAHTAVILELVKAPLAFEEAYYVGSYSIISGFAFDPQITLTEHDGTVLFSLEGEDSQWFGIIENQNSVSLIQERPIPVEILSNNHHLVFAIVAERSDVTIARSTIIISIIDDTVILGFERNIYLGSIQNEITTIDRIILSNGFSEGVVFSLLGELQSFFNITQEASAITVTLRDPIPEDLIPQNRIISLELQASAPQAISAYATLVFGIIEDEIVPLTFSETYYTGRYTEAEGIDLIGPMTLSEGYNGNVQFTLEGESAIYFEPVVANNSVTLRIREPIPQAVLINSQHLIFVIRADRDDVVTTRATIVIALIHDVAEDVVLGFDRIAYVGSIQSNVLNLDPITLSEGYSQNVSFMLHGSLSDYFTLDNEQELVTLALPNPIPEESLPSNRIIILELVATAPDSVSAYATIVLQIIEEEIIRPVFSAAYYTGHYRQADGLTFDDVMSLVEGYEETVQFALEGDNAEYFEPVIVGNSVTLGAATIPPQVILNNHHLIFTIRADKPNVEAVRVPIVISLLDVNLDEIALRFDQIAYLGSIYNDAITLDQITLREGFSTDVSFSLLGDLTTYFAVSNENETLSITLLNPIPENLIPENNIIILELLASAPQMVTGHAAIVLHIEEDLTIPRFDQIVYVGTIESGESALEPVVLSQGFTEDVIFNLQGDLANYFNLNNSGATVTITLQNQIPEESLPSNRLIILQLQATLPDAISAYTAIIFNVLEDSIENNEPLAFSEHFYTGHYTEADGLVFEETISLATGYNENIVFALEGDDARYFQLITTSENSLSLRTNNPIPPAVIANNQQLIFVISAGRTGAITTRAAIIISLYDEIPDSEREITILGFEQITYVGTIENNAINVNPIVLSEGFSSNVTFNLFGDLVDYFTFSYAEGTITITLERPIPEESISENRIIVLELQASAPDSISAHAAIVLEAIPVEPLTFGEHYYTGHYTEADGLAFDETISLATGYDENVVFVLEGDSAVYFQLLGIGNSISLQTVSPIPPAVISNNQQLIFIVSALRIGATTARATIVISLYDEIPAVEDEITLLGFERISYVGTIENNVVTLNPIILSEGFSSNVTFNLFGDLVNYFTLSDDEATVTIRLQNPIPEESIPENRIVLLELQASAPNSIAAHAAIVFEVIPTDLIPNFDLLEFSQTYYTGHYIAGEGLTFIEIISLSEGFNENINFTLEGDSSEYFDIVVLSENSVSLSQANAIPPAIVSNNQQLIFTIRAERPEAITTRATVVISLNDAFTEDQILGFERITYQGTMENTNVNLDPITLSEGYNENVRFTLHGALASYFNLSFEQSEITITLQNSIPDQSIPENQIIVLELQATAPDTLPAYATIVIEVITPTIDQLVFSQTYYTGHYIEAEGLTFEDTISLAEGFNVNVQFTLEGDSSVYFETVVSDNAVALGVSNPIPPATVLNNQQLIFTIRADRINGITARATIIIVLIDEPTEDVLLGFSRISYSGRIENDVVNIDPIILSEGFSENVTFLLHGEFSEYFAITPDGATIEISLQRSISEDSLPSSRIIILELQAIAPETMSAFTTIVFEVVQDSVEEMVFSEPFYTGRYTEDNELVFDDVISLAQGFDDTVLFSLEGDQSQWFVLASEGNAVRILLASSLPQEIVETRKLIFVIVAQRPDSTPIRAAIIISIYTSAEDCRPDDGARFERLLFEGQVQGGSVQHEEINLSGFTGTNVQILGEYAELFAGSYESGLVTVRGVGSVTLASDILYVPLELRAGSASAVLLLDVEHSEDATLPTVEFSSASYIVRVEVGQIGLIGRVQATADNGEAVRYSLTVDNAHLQQRVSINENGELHLSAPVNTGVYTFNAVATTAFSRVTETAPVHLTVEAITECGENNFVLPPLMILDRDEESAHQNLVVLDSTQFPSCRYQLNNRWPIDQSWLYVDENGLHTRPIDREHESIAFMALSQVQVELILECDSDGATRTKRSVSTAPRLDHLGPYDYGDNKWILSDSILYNPRRSLVNLIVNDINDNQPIFIGKENEPIVVGYPIAELEERILPRALAEVEATDADVGENAALVYWSSSEFLAVSPYSGSVHVRSHAQLENDSEVTIYATDRNGQGLTGSLDLLVKLVDTNHIAVVTVRQGFLEDERTILANISAAVGYDVRALKSAVISDVDTDGEVSEEREEKEDTKRRSTRQAVLSTGASLQLYVYGLLERNPVSVLQLTEDISNSILTAIIIASTVSLEDHLKNLEMCPLTGHNTGLLVATIVLSVLLFILIVAAAVWFFLRWRQKQKYEQFSDNNSLESPNDSVSTRPKPVEVKPVEIVSQPVAVAKPRINIEDLKRSERRLQEMLEAPVQEISVQPTVAPKSPDAKLNILEPPIVIQSIDKLKSVDDSDDEDEYGERFKGKRKSVVTFNENVEKIIHVEDTPDDTEYEVYKL